jgi:hypothetical protein
MKEETGRLASTIAASLCALAIFAPQARAAGVPSTQASSVNRTSTPSQNSAVYQEHEIRLLKAESNALRSQIVKIRARIAKLQSVDVPGPQGPVGSAGQPGPQGPTGPVGPSAMPVPRVREGPRARQDRSATVVWKAPWGRGEIAARTVRRARQGRRVCRGHPDSPERRRKAWKLYE